MIFVVTVISVLAFALTNIFAKKTWQTVLSIIFAGIFLISLALITANDHYHYGMKKVTETTTQTLLSTDDNKDGTEKIYLYKTNDSQKKPKTTGADHVSNIIKTSQKKSQLKTEKTYWVYKNDTTKFWFGLSSKNHQLVKERNTFDVQNEWFVLSTTQAKKLAKLAQENKNTMQNDAKLFVQEKVKTAMMQNPTMDQTTQQKIIQEATSEYQHQAMARLIAKIGKE
jgi:hypothetical protein